MKTPSTELFLLIKSLSPLEKRYFKLHSAIQSSGKLYKSYLWLFDTIDSFDAYDEEKLKIKLKNKKLVGNLKFFKSYLSEAIFKSLEKYHSNDSVEIILAQRLQRIEILFDKRLYTTALKAIDKALKLAVDHELFLFTLQLLSWKRETQLCVEKINTIKTLSDVAILEDIAYIDKYKNQLEYEQLYLQVYSREIAQTDVKDVSKRTAITKHPLLQDVKTAASYSATINYYKIMGISTRSLADWESSYKFRKKQVEYIEENQSKLVARKHDYIHAINNLLTSLDYLNKRDEFHFYYNKATTFFDTLPEKEKTNEVLHDYLITKLSYMSFLVRRMEYISTVVVAGEIAKLTKGNTLPMEESQIVFLYYFSFYAHFCLGELRMALKYLNKIAHLSDQGILRDMINKLKLFALVVHYELGNLELLISMSRSIRKFLSKSEPISEFEELVIDLFGNKIHKVDSKTEIIDLFSKTKLKIAAISKHTPISKFLDVFDFVSWLDSRIEKRSFAEVVKERS